MDSPSTTTPTSASRRPGPPKNKGGRPRDEALHAQFEDVPPDGQHVNPQTRCRHCGRQSTRLVDRMRIHLAKCPAYTAAAPTLALHQRLPSLTPRRRLTSASPATPSAATPIPSAPLAARSAVSVATPVDPNLGDAEQQLRAGLDLGELNTSAGAGGGGGAPSSAGGKTNGSAIFNPFHHSNTRSSRPPPPRPSTLPPAERDRIDRQIVRTTARNGWPAGAFDDGPGRALLATLNPAYAPPELETVERLTAELFDETRGGIVALVSLSSTLSFLRAVGARGLVRGMMVVAAPRV